MASKIPPSDDPDNPNDENRSELLQFLTALVKFSVVLALTIGMVAFVTLQPSPEAAATVIASCLVLETGGNTIPLLAADWIALKGGQILPPPIVTWPKVESGRIDLSINSLATPLLVELYKFSAIDSKGVPDEDAMEYESCELVTSSSDDSRNSGCTYRRAIDGKVRITVYSAPKYLVLGSTWYPDLGDDETSSEANVTASWAITTE
ncbi:hypothetical protein [Rhodococcus qingshengii]|uniref:hypothetical protein n=1 Tax=Rhodococcus qingshengii TaxID=334542 RepID=UPI001BEC66EF|nr:hypothetical protein [Rhodococcus qingshengii]MBT2272702.1 hypothetical protein [Rhodococcus qingshengii]